MGQHFDKIDINMMRTNIADNLKRVMKERNLSQNDLSNLCAQEGAKISQATISNLRNASQNCSLGNLVSLCNALEIPLEGLIAPKTQAPSAGSFGPGLITNPDDRAFKGYLGRYCVCFYQTIGKASELLNGELMLTPHEGTCSARLTLYTGDSAAINGRQEPVSKTYIGQMAISSPLNSAYIYLFSDEIKVICFLAFSHFHINYNELKCVMADVVTTSAGSNKRPTVHRMCITRNEVPPELLPYVKGQLLLNDAEILISEKKLDAFKNDPKVLPAFRDLVSSAMQNEHYYSVTEAKLTGNDITESEILKMVSLLRTYSVAPKYNKISRKTDKALYGLLGNLPNA